MGTKMALRSSLDPHKYVRVQPQTGFFWAAIVFFLLNRQLTDRKVPGSKPQKKSQSYFQLRYHSDDDCIEMASDPPQAYLRHVLQASFTRRLAFLPVVRFPRSVFGFYKSVCHEHLQVGWLLPFRSVRGNSLPGALFGLAGPISCDSL